MKVNDFITKAKEIEKMKTKYKLGKFMNSMTSDGTYLVDCSGLVKGILWGYPGKGKYGNNGVPDINANSMIEKCSQVTTDFKKLKPGWLVWMDGHIGIYVGDGVVIESSPIWKDGVQKSYPRGCAVANTKKLKERTWTQCGCFDKYIQY